MSQQGFREREKNKNIILGIYLTELVKVLLSQPISRNKEKGYY